MPLLLDQAIITLLLSLISPGWLKQKPNGLQRSHIPSRSEALRDLNIRYVLEKCY